MNLIDNLTQLFKNDETLTIDGKLAKNKIVELALNLDGNFLQRLLTDDKLREHFFLDIDGTLVFDKVAFQRFVNNKSFLPDSYTSFKNKIGLSASNHYINESNDVILAWPYKDCVLEGGQTKEEQKRSEIFWNETLAPDQVDNLLSPKTLTNFTKYSLDGVTSDFELAHDDNLIIKGNNLLALHSLERKFSEKVKLIYIDPPYNTESDSFKYNDNFTHSSWLTFMKNRLNIAKKLLRKDGAIFIQVDDNEQAYLKVLLDEEFGRDNFINTISVNLKNVAGASGGGEDKKLKKNIEYIHVYAKSYEHLKHFSSVYEYIPISEIVESYRELGMSWKYTTVLTKPGKKIYVASTETGDGEEIKIYKRENPEFKSINQVIKDEGISESEAYAKYAEKIFQTAMPQSSIRPRVMEKVRELGINGDFFSIEYVPRTGKNKGKVYEQFYKGNTFRLLAWLRDVSEEIDGVLCKKEKQGTYWDFVGETKNLSKEGKVELLSGKKPEKMLARIIQMTTQEGDLVLDYHLGSGTTAAVAHKLKRKYIGIEQLDYEANSPKVRLSNVVNGDQSGISKDIGWQGGGSFVYCELAESAAKYCDLVEKAETSNDLISIWEKLKSSINLSYKVDPLKFDKNINEFMDLSFIDQQKFLLEAIDKNQLYVNYSEIEDQSYDISDKDKTLNKKFYGA